MQVLLVEDDAVLSDGLTRVLQAHGMQVDLAADGLVADNLLLNPRCSVAVLDIGLPGIDGFEVVRALRARKQPPVIMLTARERVEDRIRGLRDGADDYLGKPFSFQIGRAHV